MGILNTFKENAKKVGGLWSKGLQTAGKVVGKVAEHTTTPITKAMLSGPALLAEQVSPTNSFSKTVFDNTQPNTKERAGVAAKEAASLLSALPIASGMKIGAMATRVGQQTLAGGLMGGGSAASVSKSNAEIKKEALKGAVVSALFSVGTEGLSALARSRAALRNANEMYSSSLRPDAKTRQKELELQFRDGITRFGDKVHAEYGPNSLDGYIKSADNNIKRYGSEYRSRLQSAYKDSQIFTDDIVNEFSDTYAKSKLGSMNEKETSMLNSLVKQYKLGGTNSPERILDIRQAIDGDIPSSAWRAWKGGEPVSENVEMKILFRDALNNTLSALNPDDSILQIANKKMSFAFEVRRLAAVQKDILNMSKKAGTTEAMGFFDKVLARTLLSTPSKTRMASGIMNLQNSVGGGAIRNALVGKAVTTLSNNSKPVEDSFQPLDQNNMSIDSFQPMDSFQPISQ